VRVVRVGVATVGLALLGFFLIGVTSAQQPGAGQEEKQNMELVGYNDLQARSAYQSSIKRHGDRWIAYVGHHGGTALNPLTGRQEPNGTSILDVTNPRQPRYLAHIPGEAGQGEEAGGSQMLRICEGSQLPRADKSKVYLLRTVGSTGQEIFDVTDPANPARVTVVASGLRATHENWWECDTGIAYLVSGAPGWRVDRIAQIYDLSDPAKPVFIRDFGLPGQQPGGQGPPLTGLHGAVSTGPNGNRVYLGYGRAGGGIIQVVDRDKLLNGPKEPTNQNLLYPQISRMDLPPTIGSPGAFPVLGVTIPEFGRMQAAGVRDFLVITSESSADNCREARQMVWFVDITTESMPFGVANWTVPEASGSFCDRGGRFGTHSSNESFAPIYYKKVMFFAHYNAGVRAVDIRNPFSPKEIGYYIPAITEKTDRRCVTVDGQERCKPTIQTNNAEVDDRGYIYMVDRARTGMHILELAGDARKVADLP